jgi:putative oxidoreductase
MNALILLYARLSTNLSARLNRADWVLPTLARFCFAAVLASYFWVSAMTKLGDGLFGFLSPSIGAYVQIFPRQFQAVGYDVTQLTVLHWAVVVAGTCAEFLLPLMIVIGLMTRLAAVGMIGFVVLQSLTDVYGHAMIDPQTLGTLFDTAPDGHIMDQRLMWICGLMIIVIKGAGPLSIDHLLTRLDVFKPALIEHPTPSGSVRPTPNTLHLHPQSAAVSSAPDNRPITPRARRRG